MASAKKINVASSAIACRISDVDITRHSCELRFGSKKVSVNGRKAHELYAILIEIGASPEGAAGSIIATVANLDCSIDPGEIRRMAGGGAHCAYDAAK